MDIGFIFESAIDVILMFLNFSFTIWGLTFQIYQVFIFVALVTILLWFFGSLING